MLWATPENNTSNCLDVLTRIREVARLGERKRNAMPVGAYGRFYGMDWSRSLRVLAERERVVLKDDGQLSQRENRFSQTAKCIIMFTYH